MTTWVKGTETRRMSLLTQPAGIEDMLDYQLYLLYRDCGYVIERLCQVEFGVSRRRWRILATLSAARSMFARFRQVNKQLLRDLSEDQVQHLCTAISILRNTATQLNIAGVRAERKVP